MTALQRSSQLNSDVHAPLFFLKLRRGSRLRSRVWLAERASETTEGHLHMYAKMMASTEGQGPLTGKLPWCEGLSMFLR